MNYEDFIASQGMTQDDVDVFVLDKDDLISMGIRYYVSILFSRIHGLGMFATTLFQEGDKICPAMVGAYRTEAGRYINHSDKPNVKMVRHDGGIMTIACKDIIQGDELLVDYEVNAKLNEQSR